jgi:plastocyanin
MKKLALSSLLVLTAMVACSSSSTDNTGSSSGSSGAVTPEGGTTPATNEVTVLSNMFVPATLTIKKGDTVTWKWGGGAHSVTSGANCTSDGMYGVGVQTTGTFQHKYDTAGTFEYFCIPHCASSNMKGTIIVQ